MTPDPSIADDWFWRIISAVGSAIVSAGAMIFATRKTSEANLLARVDARVETAFERQDLTIARQDAEIENLQRTMKAEKAECDTKLAALEAEIARLMLLEPIASYTSTDIVRGQRTVKAAQARQRGKK